jgi:beta-glucanase (GH16 family)
VFSVTWNATEIKWYVDDVLFNTINITPEGLSEFHNEYFFIFNVAVGGNWPGSPDGTTVFPQRMIVDYVRVFQPQ